MYNETIYNVLISPEIQEKIYKRSNVYISSVIVSLLFGMALIIVFVLDMIGVITSPSWINVFVIIVGIIIGAYDIYAVKFNPIKKYHISLQIYYYLIFLNYFYFENNKYLSRYKDKLKYMAIIQSCIDTINTFIKIMKEFLITGENTIAKIIYMKKLRTLLYKIKRKDFFEVNIDEFKSILNDFYSSTHKGLIAVLEFEENVECLDNIDFESRIEACNVLLNKSQSSNKPNKNNEMLNIKKSERLRLVTGITAFLITLVMVAIDIFISDEIWTKIVAIFGTVGTGITVGEYLRKTL